MRCVGAPVFNEHGEVVGALSVSGPTVRMTDERLGELGPLVKRAAADFTDVGGAPQAASPGGGALDAWPGRHRAILILPAPKE